MGDQERSAYAEGGARQDLAYEFAVVEELDSVSLHMKLSTKRLLPIRSIFVCEGDR